MSRMTLRLIALALQNPQEHVRMLQKNLGSIFTSLIVLCEQDTERMQVQGVHVAELQKP